MAVAAPLGSSDHLSLSADISMTYAILDLCVSRNVLVKHLVNWTAVCDAIGELSWQNIWSTDNPVERSNVHLSLLVGRSVPTKVIRVCNKDKPWFNGDCRSAYNLKQAAHLRWARDRSRVTWVLTMRVGGATSQLDLPSPTPLSIAGCGRLQLGVLQWATSVITASSW